MLSERCEQTDAPVLSRVSHPEVMTVASFLWGKSKRRRRGKAARDSESRSVATGMASSRLAGKRESVIVLRFPG